MPDTPTLPVGSVWSIARDGLTVYEGWDVSGTTHIRLPRGSQVVVMGSAQEPTIAMVVWSLLWVPGIGRAHCGRTSLQVNIRPARG